MRNDEFRYHFYLLNLFHKKEKWSVVEIKINLEIVWEK